MFVAGSPIGREDVTIRTDATGTTINSEGQTAAGGTTVVRRVEIRYGSDRSPERFSLQGSVNGKDVALRTTFNEGSAVSEGTEDGKPIAVTKAISPGAIVIPNGVFAGFAALPSLLAGAVPGHEFRVFLVPSHEVSARVTSVSDDRMQTGTSLFDVRRYGLLLADPQGELAITLTTALDGSLLRVTIPAQGVDVLRSDIAGATARPDVYSNKGDQPALIPAAGFNLGATVTVPLADAARAGRFPAVVLVSGARAPNRDSLVPGVPTMAQLAGSLADAGFLVVRFDRRGSGQSGGRAESATLSDYAEDVRTVVRWISARKDVDQKRIAVIGHGEGAWNALLAASRENRIAAVGSLEGAGTTGAELVLEQQQQQFDLEKTPDAERASRVALQKQVLAAVLSGKGWDDVLPEVRRQADTPWFQSLLAYDPAKVLEDIDVPVLIVHAELDREIPVAHAERLADLARKGDSESVELVTVRGVNHLLIPAFTGDVSEYPSLTDRNISKDVSSTIALWLTKTLPAPAR